ncbi:mitogen-activated protein kinase kinase kinase 3-like isoform X2 [Stylophora pistillata]|nr:mitogen-activated protein kinase kinase kinase 3-like isoform X2 [Stylophora pistillata]
MSTLLVLLTNSCGLVPPSTGWNKLPPAPDKSKEAHLARLKHFRRAVYAHTTYAYVKDPEFSRLWKEICNVIVELGGAGYGTAISRLKNDSLHADTVEHYRQLLNQWKQDEVNFKEAFRELEAVKKVEHTMKETLKLGEFLGGGAYGKVYKCFLNSNGFEHPCAVKVVEIKPHSTETRTEVDVFKNEISILSTLKHERILTYYGSEEKDNHLHLFMELMERGSLYDYIKKKKCLDEWESRKFTRQILEGVSFLHSENVIHRDIKGSNVLIDLHGNIKLADFGLSKWIEKIGSKSNLFSYVGTPYWMAPEMFWGKGYGRKFDIWGVGCTVVEMLTGRPPLGHLEEPAAIFKIGSEPTTPTLPEDVSQDGRDFIKATLTWNPDERPWADELLHHRFLEIPT